MTITVLKPGALSQLQDLGRYGYQRFGVVVGGAMDEWSHRVANALVGNDEHEATIEITLTGPSLRFDAPARVAICGADLSPRVDGEGGTHALPHGRPVDIAAGSQLRFGARVAGVRAYLAVAGGTDNVRAARVEAAFSAAAAATGAGAAVRPPTRSTSPLRSARPSMPPKPPRMKVLRLPITGGTSSPPATAR